MNRVAPKSNSAEEVACCAAEINLAWSRSGEHTLEFARGVSRVRRRLRYGGWSELWRATKMPFSKRTGENLVAIGEGLLWVDAQLFAHLPVGWSVRHHLARLPRHEFERLFQSGAIHPRLSVKEAKDFLAPLAHRNAAGPSATTTASTRRISRFRHWLAKVFKTWPPDMQAAARSELAQLIEWIERAATCDPPMGITLPNFASGPWACSPPQLVSGVADNRPLT